LRPAQEVASALGWQAARSFSSDVVVPDRQKAEAEILYAKLSSLIMLDDSDIFYFFFQLFLMMELFFLKEKFAYHEVFLSL
jgi:hypothetical protein